MASKGEIVFLALFVVAQSTEDNSFEIYSGNGNEHPHSRYTYNKIYDAIENIMVNTADRNVYLNAQKLRYTLLSMDEHRKTLSEYLKRARTLKSSKLKRNTTHKLYSNNSKGFRKRRNVFENFPPKSILRKSKGHKSEIKKCKKACKAVNKKTCDIYNCKGSRFLKNCNRNCKMEIEDC